MSMEIKSMALDLGRGAMLFLLLERFFGKLGYARKRPAGLEAAPQGALVLRYFKEPRVF